MENNNLINNESKPDNNLVICIVTIVLCCWPLGLVGLLKATKVDSLWAEGKHEEARNAAADAKKWAYIGMACGAVIWVFVLIFYGYLFSQGGRF